MGVLGKTVAIVCPDNRHFTHALLGALYAGAIPVPIGRPEAHRPARGVARMAAVMADARVQAVLTTSAGLAAFERTVFSLAPELRELPWIVIDDVQAAEAEDWLDPHMTRDDLAWLQYTAGTTGTPKGVMITHGNVLASIAAMKERLVRDPATLVSWLPLQEASGSIASLMYPLMSLGRSVLLDPETVLRRPAIWLRALSDYRASATVAPSSGYQLCTHAVQESELDGLDLSCVEQALVGGEPIRHAELQAFRNRFAPQGWRPTAFSPFYGLAEASGCVSCRQVATGSPILRADIDALERGFYAPASRTRPAVSLIGCGKPLAGVEVRILVPGTRQPCSPGAVGEIWLAGPTVAAGYWWQPEATARLFESRLAGRMTPFLRTGDLGFLHRGQLYITSRLEERPRAHRSLSGNARGGLQRPAVQEARSAAKETHTVALSAVVGDGRSPSAPDGNTENGWLLSNGSDRAPVATRKWRATLAGKPYRLQRSLLNALLRAEVAAVLDLPTSASIPEGATWGGLGLDSPRLTELKQRVEFASGMTLATDLATAHATIADLGDVLLDRLRASRRQTPTLSLVHARWDWLPPAHERRLEAILNNDIAHAFGAQAGWCAVRDVRDISSAAIRSMARFIAASVAERGQQVVPDDGMSLVEVAEQLLQCGATSLAIECWNHERELVGLVMAGWTEGGGQTVSAVCSGYSRGDSHLGQFVVHRSSPLLDQELALAFPEATIQIDSATSDPAVWDGLVAQASAESNPREVAVPVWIEREARSA